MNFFLWSLLISELELRSNVLCRCRCEAKRTQDTFHRVIILLERVYAFTIEWEETDANFPTRMCNVTPWRHSRLLAHWIIALYWRGLRGIPRELQRLLSPIGYGSTGGISGRSLTAGKIIFTGRQTCLPLFSIMTLWYIQSQLVHLPTTVLTVSKSNRGVFLGWQFPWRIFLNKYVEKSQREHVCLPVKRIFPAVKLRLQTPPVLPLTKEK